MYKLLALKHEVVKPSSWAPEDEEISKFVEFS